MGVTHEAAARLSERREFHRLIQIAGATLTDRLALEPAVRVLVAHALAATDNHEEAARLAELDRDAALPAGVRSRAEWVLGFIRWREGDIYSAHNHARAALRLAQESGESGRIAWASLQLFRLMIDSGRMDAIVAMLPKVRRFVSKAGDPQITAYLHNCVGILEGQTGRLNEARRHLDIAESLLELAPNAWLASSVLVNRGSVEYMDCRFDRATECLRIAKQLGRNVGYAHSVIAADTSLGHLAVVTGQWEKATEILKGLIQTASKAPLHRIAGVESAARMHLALHDLERCREAFDIIDAQITLRPEITSVHQVRWSAISRARLFVRLGQLDEALDCLRAAMQQAIQIADIPLQAAARLVTAQVLEKKQAPGAASHLVAADALGITRIADLQAQYYYGSAMILRGLEPSLSHHLAERGLRLWADQGVVSVRMEMDDVPADGPGENPASLPSSVGPAAVECVADSLASFTDLAHRPRLLAAEMLWTIRALECSSDATLVETRENAKAPEATDASVVLPLGVDRKKQLTLVCGIPDSPVKAILLADVLRMGRHALELEQAREDERNRAALWPAPPIEEQAGALFIAEDMQTLLATARRIAPTTIPVLITGETGTGKEVLARTIHAYSSRAAAAFLPFNCSSVPKDMLDSQLFGHRKGSFTGAAEHFPGVIRAAAGGTLFLDEIGETTLDVQPKLLRFLESNEVHPIGETHPTRVDVRVIAATNADLETLVAQGRLREDLFYRLNIVRLHVPPLRERRVEIPSLAHHYLEKHAQEYKKGNLRLAEETMEYLVLYRWPGNVRQLANEMRRLAALAEADAVLMPEHLSTEIAASRRTVPASQRVLDPTEIVVRIDQPMSAAVQHLERAMIQHALRTTGGRMEESASLLGVSRKGLYLKRVRYGLDESDTSAVA